MRLRDVEQVQRIPGTSQVSKRIVTEWICPECDYFEEADNTALTREADGLAPKGPTH
jgi:hypothetical protein